MPRCSIYPHFEVLHNGKQLFVPQSCAARLLSEGATLGTTVRESDDTNRDLTDAEQHELTELAMEWTTSI